MQSDQTTVERVTLLQRKIPAFAKKVGDIVSSATVTVWQLSESLA
jgi:hypothetical protein